MVILYLIILLILILVTIGISAIIFFNFLFPILWGAPYAPANVKDIDDALAMANIQPGQKAADLGSGDGRAVLMMEKLGANAVGYEISPLLVIWSNAQARKLGSKAKFFRQSFWTVDLSQFDVIFLYQLPHVMRRLRAKLETELKPTAQVVCIGFKLEGWQPQKTNGRVFVYTKPV